MKSEMIPYSPFPLTTLKKLSTRFEGIGFKISNAFPSLQTELRQAEIDLNAKEFGAIIFLLSVFYFFAGALIAFLLAYRLFPTMAIISALTIGAMGGVFIFTQLVFYPKIKIKKKVRNIEGQLVFALRTILIEIKSSVTLFNAMNIIGQGNFGDISKEFKKAIDKINTGTIEEDALDQMASDNPSLHFRRALWQLVNGIKAGADVSAVLSSLVDSMLKEQKNEVKLYGAALKLLSLVYMMIGVIVPAMGLTLLIILSTFPQITIAEIYFWVMLMMLLVAQLMYIGIIKSKRPSLIGE